MALLWAAFFAAVHGYLAQVPGAIFYCYEVYTPSGGRGFRASMSSGVVRFALLRPSPEK
jgi:hypothetical protein